MFSDSPILSIVILLVIFVGLPSLLKRLAQYNAANRDEEVMNERSRDSLHPERIDGHLEEPHIQDIYERNVKGSISSKPIEPKWF